MSKVKVRLLTSRIDGDESNVAGDVIEVDAAEAKVLLETEQASPVTESRAKRATKATAKEAETR
jgi:hypothetical protein